MNLQQKLEEAEALVASVREALDKGEEVKPLFPLTNFYSLHGDSLVYASASARYGSQGNSFYTEAEAKKEALRRAAKVRVLEKINIANRGDNGFKVGHDNLEIQYNYDTGKLRTYSMKTNQFAVSEFYLREDYDGALLQDPSFVADYKLYLGVEDGTS